MDYWGYLITDQHPPQPAQMFRRLLSGMAEYIIDHMEPLSDRALTPAKLSAFYRAVGGSGLDELFLGTSSEKLSNIYSTLGCAHSLQPVPDNDFVPPAIPALTPRGFVIWQTIQLLMEPAEHVPYIRTAVSEFALRDPGTGDFFPREIPLEAFPRYPDRETLEWHDSAFAKKAAAESTAQAPRKQTVEDDPSYYYSPSRRHRRHHKHHRHHSPPRPQSHYPTHTRSAPGSGPETSYHRRHRSFDSSDIDVEEYAPPSRPRHRHHHHAPVPPAPQRHFPAKSYVYANGDALPIYTTTPAASTLHGYQSYPNLHASGYGDLRSRFQTQAPRRRTSRGRRQRYYDEEGEAEVSVDETETEMEEPAAGYDSEEGEDEEAGWMLAEERRRGLKMAGSGGGGCGRRRVPVVYY